MYGQTAFGLAQTLGIDRKQADLYIRAYFERYSGVRRWLDATMADVRRSVIALRRGKSMVLDPADENRRSAGSFFVNPVVPAAVADEAAARAAKLAPGQTMPRYPQPGGDKLSAAWLIERAGLTKGTRRGAVGRAPARGVPPDRAGWQPAAAGMAAAPAARPMKARRE